MNILDTANFDEIEQCNLNTKDDIIFHNKYDFGPDYINICNKSIGHCFGPMFIVDKLGYGTRSEDFNNVFNFFKHYLSAKQLNDDAHDWEEDLKEHRLTAVTDIIFKELKKPHINLEELDEIRILFWDEIILDICQLIDKHLDEANSCISNSNIIRKDNHLLQLVNDLKKISKKTLMERDHFLKFMKGYKKTRS
jgi:hypothetical protein